MFWTRADVGGFLGGRVGGGAECKNGACGGGGGGISTRPAGTEIRNFVEIPLSAGGVGYLGGGGNQPAADELLKQLQSLVNVYILKSLSTFSPLRRPQNI